MSSHDESIAAESPRARAVVRLFDLARSGRGKSMGKSMGKASGEPPVFDDRLLDELLPPCGAVTLLNGPSGSGKSSLLRALRKRVDAIPGAVWIDVDSIEISDSVPVVDCFEPLPLHETLRLLSRAGLAEAWTWLRRPAQLSDGQRWRLKLALTLRKALARPSENGAPVILACDEFASLLDRVTAAAVGRMLRKCVTASLRAIVATAHDDLVGALVPDTVARCDFSAIHVARFPASREVP